MLRIKTLLVISLFVLSSGYLYAGVIVGGTRLVYSGDKKEASISVKNPEKDKPYLIQSWVDDSGPDDTEKGNKKPPFIVTPPLFRLDTDSENSIRVVKTEETSTLPKDREKVYWLNIKSIPASSKTASESKNSLQIAVKTRIKLFFRPEGIEFDPSEDAEKITFSKQSSGKLVVHNPTPFYFTFYTLKVGNENIKTGNLMLSPKGDTVFEFNEKGNENQVIWSYINDFGGVSKEFKSSLK